MVRKLKPSRDKVKQISVCLPGRQHEFFENYQEFSVHKWARDGIDEQIAQIAPKFLKDGDKRKQNGE